jgi:uncharacterized repeat protein (TIGR03843 family)
MPALQPTETSAITGPDWQPQVVTVEGRYVEASNATLLGETEDGVRVIYKPVDGARPLWDFDARTLAYREVWAYRIDQALGFANIPETTMADGPFGRGAVQRHVEAAADQEVIDLINASDAALWPIAVLDLVLNNADRKAGHILRDDQAWLWAIDHGLTFHIEEKLRTVLWGFAGRPIPRDIVDRLCGARTEFGGQLGEQFAGDLSRAELTALLLRMDALIESGHHPTPPEDRHSIPWPPY